MNRPIVLALALVLCAWALPAATPASPKTTKRRHHAATSAHTATTAKSGPAKSAVAKTHASKTTGARKSSTRKGSRTTASRHGKKSRRTARSYQQAPTPERYGEIQRALAGKGYFQGEANGKWGPDSIDALKRFQADQNLMPDGKLTSLSLIALGLGPKRLTAKSDSTALPPPGPPKAEPPR